MPHTFKGETYVECRDHDLVFLSILVFFSFKMTYTQEQPFLPHFVFMFQGPSEL